MSASTKTIADLDARLGRLEQLFALDVAITHGGVPGIGSNAARRIIQQAAADTLARPVEPPVETREER